MTTAAAAEADVDSSGQQGADDAGPTRRKIITESLGAGERRRVVDVQIGGYEYDARCPKLVVWTDLAQIIADQRGTSRSERRKAGDKSPAAEGRVTTDRVRLTQAMTHFLRGCLTAADWDAIEVDLGDPDNDLDIPDLWAAGIKLVIEFKPDMREMAQHIGMKVPNVLEQIDTDTMTLDEPAPPPAPAKRAARGRGSRAR